MTKESELLTRGISKTEQNQRSGQSPSGREAASSGVGHTPGPWKVTRDREILAPHSDEIICWGYHEDFGALLCKIKPANARLIAAAPDLLTSLKVIAGMGGKQAAIASAAIDLATLSRD